MQEVNKAVYQLALDKAPGADCIPAEVFKEGSIKLKERLLCLYNNIWEAREVPQAFKDALIVHIYKRKGDRAFCDNHRVISLLSIAGKILGRIIMK